jgi:hypothetical protein
MSRAAIGERIAADARAEIVEKADDFLRHHGRYPTDIAICQVKLIHVRMAAGSTGCIDGNKLFGLNVHAVTS